MIYRIACLMISRARGGEIRPLSAADLTHLGGSRYHPHFHGLVDSAMLGGASGLIVVQGLEQVDPRFTAAIRAAQQPVVCVS
jgi:hypothetical protein